MWAQEGCVNEAAQQSLCDCLCSSNVGQQADGILILNHCDLLTFSGENKEELSLWSSLPGTPGRGNLRAEPPLWAQSPGESLKHGFCVTTDLKGRMGFLLGQQPQLLGLS